jgi:hypothetical protein
LLRRRSRDFESRGAGLVLFPLEEGAGNCPKESGFKSVGLWAARAVVPCVVKSSGPQAAFLSVRGSSVVVMPFRERALCWSR